MRFLRFLPVFMFLISMSGTFIMPFVMARYSHDLSTKQPSFYVYPKSPQLDLMDTISTLDADFSKKLSIRLNDTHLQGLQIGVYEFGNNGTASIRPEDFVKSISFAARPPWRVISILKVPPPVSTFSPEWTQGSSHEWTMKPTLFNPGDHSYVALFATRETDKARPATPTDTKSDIFSFTLPRITNVSTIETTEKPKYSRTIIMKWLQVVLVDHEILMFLAFQLILFCLFLCFARTSASMPRLSLWSAVLLVCALLLSTCTAEIITSLFTTPVKTQWLGSWPLILAQFFFLISFPAARLGSHWAPQVSEGNNQAPSQGDSQSSREQDLSQVDKPEVPH